MMIQFCNCTERDNNQLSSKESGDDALDNAAIWTLDTLDYIGGHAVTILGNPVRIETPNGPALRFDGIDDGMMVHADPLEGASHFTLEVVFRPDTSYPNNQEQRFVHIQNPDNENRRILIETRLTPDHQWFLDTYIQSEKSSKTLYGSTWHHPIGKWYHAALVLKDGVMHHYVDGKKEMSGTVNYLPIENGQTSIGMRMNRKYWFKGAIRTLVITSYALSPDDFIISDTGVR